MGLYDVVMGDGRQAERGELLLQILGAPAVARFRDAWVEKGEDSQPVIAIYTRQGGGNRECYCGEEPCSCSSAVSNAILAAHPLYIRDADDEFDATYATFYFQVPEPLRERLAEVARDPVNMSERWQEAIARVESGELRPAETALADQLGAFLSDPDPGDGPRIMQV
jgi:hypothetical protein